MWEANQGLTERGRRVAESVDLQKGEIVFFCPYDNYVVEKNAVPVNQCGKCGGPLRFVSRKDEK